MASTVNDPKHAHLKSKDGDDVVLSKAELRERIKGSKSNQKLIKQEFMDQILKKSTINHPDHAHFKNAGKQPQSPPEDGAPSPAEVGRSQRNRPGRKINFCAEQCSFSNSFHDADKTYCVI